MRCLHCPCPPRRGSQVAVYCLHLSSPASLLFWEDYRVVCIIACSGADCSNRAEFQEAQTSGLTGQGKGTASEGRRNNPGSWVDPLLPLHAGRYHYHETLEPKASLHICLPTSTSGQGLASAWQKPTQEAVQPYGSRKHLLSSSCLLVKESKEPTVI